MIPEHEWLTAAKRLPVGMRDRVYHRKERRKNMVIAHDRDRWWCWCQACKEGAVVMKEHVLLTAPIQVQERDLTVPNDMRPVLGSGFEDTVGHFLARKGMMFPYLPKLWLSESTRRLCMQDAVSGWHGRDITERSSAKWLHYSKPVIAGSIARCTIITEDIFSMFKVQYAMGDEYAVASTMGAGCSVGAALALKNCKTIVWAYDGDHAGDAGYASGSKRMRAFGSRQFRARPPEGLDPKDMDCQDIRDMIQGALNAR